MRVDPADRPVLRSRAWRIAIALLAAMLLALSTVGIDDPAGAIAILLVAAAIAAAVLGWALIRTRRQRLAHEDELTAWAAERAVQAERLRIARELHDLASHGLGLITVRAAAARTVGGAAGEAERAAALADIERAGRETTTELRRMLTVLRTPGDDAPLRPAATLRELPGIVAAAARSGIAATLELAELGPVSAGTQLTICAIVREALANTARHAGPTAVRVRVGWDADAIAVAVSDQGPAAGWLPQLGAGAGLAGLHEQVRALGGTLRAGPDEHGWLLTARLPEPLHAAERRGAGAGVL